MEWMDPSLKNGSMSSIRHVESVDFISHMEIIKKSIGAVCKVVLTSRNCADDHLLSNLRSCLSDAPAMSKSREDLRNM